MGRKEMIAKLSVVLLLLFCSIANADIHFLDKKQASLAIVDDSSEPYFDVLQTMEMAAKTGSPVSGDSIQEQRMQCRRRYINSVKDFTASEKKAITFYVDKIQPTLQQDYPIIGNVPWNFIKVSDSLEGGLPHTRGGNIVLSESMCNMIVMTKSGNNVDGAHLGIIDVLVHEQIHVFQRSHQELFNAIYTDSWGFEEAKSITGCQWLVKHKLTNPDATSCHWVFPVKRNNKVAYLWPIVVFAEGDDLKKMPDDFRMIAISLTKENDKFAVQVDGNHKPVFQDIFEVPEFRKIFFMTSNIYHPDEASADLLAKVFVFDHFIPESQFSPEEKMKIESYISPLRSLFKKSLNN